MALQYFIADVKKIIICRELGTLKAIACNTSSQIPRMHLHNT